MAFASAVSRPAGLMRAAGSHSRAMAVCQAALRPSSATGVVSRRSGASHLAQRQQEQLKRGARLVVEAGKVKKISGEELELEIQDRDRPLIVDFFATWCGPCLLLAQELEKVADQLGDKVKILKIDVDENPELSSQLRIEGLPTVVFIPKDGSKPALRTEGLLPAEQIIEIVNEQLS